MLLPCGESLAINSLTSVLQAIECSIVLRLPKLVVFTPLCVRCGDAVHLRWLIWHLEYLSKRFPQKSDAQTAGMREKNHVEAG